MSYSWEDLTSKSDIFYNALPLFNQKGELEDNLSFKFTSKPKNSSYSFLANHTNGRRGRVEFQDKVLLENLYNTELGFRINSKPGVRLSAKLSDKLIPLAGSSLTVSLESDSQQESANAAFNYADKLVNLAVSLSYPVQPRVFDLPVQNADGEAVKQTPTLNFEALFRPFEGRDLYTGVQSTFKTASEDTKSRYDVRGIIATKTASFEGGLYVRKAVDTAERQQLGAWATSTNGDTTISSHFSYDLSKNQFSYENFASFQGRNDDRFFLGVQVVPKLSPSFGYERAINSRTKLTFAYAYLLSSSAPTEKQSAVRFSLELTH